MERRARGLAIVVAGTIAISPDAALLRLMDAAGASVITITVWRNLVVALINIIGVGVFSGGARELVASIRIGSSVGPFIAGSLLLVLQNVGYVVSLLKVDAAKALLVISLNPLWAALLAYLVLGDAMATKTIVAQVCTGLSLLVIFAPTLFPTVISTAAGLPVDAAETSELVDLVPLATGFAVAAFLCFSSYCSRIAVNDAALDAAPAGGAVLTALLALAWAVHREAETGHNLYSHLFDVEPAFWLWLIIDGVCTAAFNAANVVAPRFISSTEVALVLLGETLLGPLWVFAIFGVVPPAMTLAGGALLLATLVGHEIVGMWDAKKETRADTKAEPLLPPADSGC